MRAQMYLEAMLDSFHAVRARPEITQLPEFPACVDAMVPFLARHFRSAEVVGPDMREMLLQTVSMLLQSKPYIAKFEASHEARSYLVRVHPLCAPSSSSTEFGSHP
jgi:Kip1 ubiquitination-promoting complex protein 1